MLTMFAQDVLYFDDVQAAPGKSKEYLFVKTRNWLQEQLGNTTLDINEIERGELGATYFIPYGHDAKINYFIRILVDEGKYYCRISDYEMIGRRSNGRNFDYGIISTSGYVIPKGGTGIASSRTRQRQGQEVVDYIESHAYHIMDALKTYLANLPIEDHRRLEYSTGLDYQESFQIKKADQQKTFELARLWFARYFENANENYRELDKENGRISCRAYLPYQCKLELDNLETEYEYDVVTFPDFKGDIGYTIDLEIADAQCNISVRDFAFIGKDKPYLIKDDLECMSFENYPEIETTYEVEVCEELNWLAADHANWMMGSFRRHIYKHLGQKAQNYNNIFPEDMLLYEDVVKMTGRSKAALYGNAISYVAANYESPENLTEILDAESGEIFFTSFLEYEPDVFNGWETRSGVVLFDVYLQIREEEYHYSFSNFRHEANAWLKESQDLGAVLKTEDCLQFDENLSRKKQEKICAEIKTLIAARIAADEKELRESMAAAY